ncbi:hypothetical protein AB0H42_04360 [Nocardia sp. NPDC050799]|uniref:hypothetical protein n=1 Tax=Nocardia sp. NPDC050799 TaxID=3154842 RepID=UPI0033E6381B
MTTIDHPAPFRPGDRVRIEEINQIGQLAGTHLTGEVLESPDAAGFVRVRVDGSGARIVFHVYRVQLDGPTELDLIEQSAQLRAQAEKDRLAALRAESEQLAAEVSQRVGDALEASKRPVLELLEGTGISVHRVAEVFDGRDCFTVSEAIVLALAAGVSDLRALFGPADAEVTR